MSMMFVLASQIVADTEAPSTPVFNTLTALDGSNSLAWSASTDNVGVAFYDIYSGSTSNPAVHTLESTVISPTLSAFSGSYTQGVIRYYHIKARDAAGNTSAASNVKSVTNNTVPF